jgi:very-short-patch-repair endonuclease
MLNFTQPNYQNHIMKQKRRIISYNPKLKLLARKLRNDSTKSEIILWKYLKGKQMFGYDFHRQKPLDNYIVDFFCHELMLAIELDGYSHQLEEVIEKDRIKEEKLKKLGLTVLRFEDKEVYHEINNVLRRIELFIEEFERTHPRQR